MTRNDFNRFSLTELLLSPFRLLRDLLGRGGESQSFGSGGESGGIGGLITFPFRFLWGAILFGISLWSSSRPALAFVLGIPAVLIALGGLAGLTVLPWLLKVETKSQQIYLVQVNRHTTPKLDEAGRPDRTFVKDLEKASFCAQRLLDITPEDRDMQFLHANLLPAYRKNEAREIMNSLANFTEQSYIPANTWIARDAVETSLRDPEKSAEYQELAMKHLQVGSDIKSPDGKPRDLTIEEVEAQISLIRLLILKKDYQRAEEMCVPLIKHVGTSQTPEIFLSQFNVFPLLLQCLLETQQTERLEVTRNEVIKQILVQSRRNTGSVRLWNYLIELLVQTKSYDRALEELALAERLVPIGIVRDIRDLRAQVFRQQAMDIEVTNEKSFQQKLGLLSEGLVSGTITTANLLAATMLQMCQQVDDPAARTLWLENALVENSQPVVAQVLLGYFAGITENFEECKKQWDLAFRKNPGAADYAGVLLFVAPKVDPGSIPQQRRMAQVALELFPERNYVNFNLARIAVYTKEYALAEKTSMAILEKNPNSIDALAILLRVYRDTKDSERERALLEKFSPEERKQLETLAIGL